MKDKLNMDLRSEILRNSLFTENGVNGLLLSYLAIFEKEKTKNFGNRAGISFKSKIDLLYDIKVLNKEEHFNLELQMIFRNKFLHDLEFNSFVYCISKLDTSIVNKLKKFFESDNESQMEEKYRKAYRNLYLNNAKMLKEKLGLRTEKITKSKDFIVGLTDSFTTTIDLSFDLASDIYEILQNSEIEDPKILELSNKISKRCKVFTDEMENNSVLVANRKLLENTTKEDLINLLK
ncbi:MAG: hypothetical protein WDZ45_11105 [Flavobacteriaceae bacterium]